MGLSAHPLDAFRRWPAYMACHLTNRKGVSGKNAPVIDQRAYDRTEGELPVVTRLRDGDIVGYKYFDFGTGALPGAQVSLEFKPASRGRVDVVLDDPRSGDVVATVPVVGPAGAWTSFTATMPAVSGVRAVYLVAHPEGQELGDLSYLAFSAESD
jgi:hypothetical protein